MKTMGRHLIAEFYGCEHGLLDDREYIRQALLQAAHCIGAEVLSDTFNRFSPQGVSGTVVIAESHLSIHTWPEYGYVAADIFTCGGLDPNPGFEALGRSLRSKTCRRQEILRGLPEHLAHGGDLLPTDVKLISRTAELITLGEETQEG